MKHSVLTMVLVMSGAAATPALARTNVAEKVAQLAENKEASKENLKQYEENLKTVSANLKDTKKAMKDLDTQKKSLAKQTGDTAKGKKSVDAVRLQLTGYMKTEQTKLDVERKQIEELKKTLAALEANSQVREQNIAQYQEKMEKVDTELASWGERNQSIIELEQALAEKMKVAEADHKRLSEKQESYENEVGKWKKQVRVSERMHQNFANLKD
ncbi:MAG: hypothetical protein V4692_12545 [Bdellovibrionota bacterium]